MRLRKSIKLVFVSALIFTFVFAGAVNAQDSMVPGSNNVVADIASEVDESVVMISTEREVSMDRSHPFYDDPFFRYFFPDQFPEDQGNQEDQEPDVREGFGSGFIVSEDGYIVTNQHVLQGSDRIYVTIKGHEEPFEAEVLWADQGLDLAIIQVDADIEFNPIPLADSDEIRQGEWAIAIGNPLGFDHTVTTGVVSALGQPIQVPTQDGVRNYRNLIQTDAAINPGNSGGPLLNIDGEVIGINTAVATRAQGIGFAIPVNEVKFAIEDLEEHGMVQRPWLGVYYRSITQDIQDHLNLESQEGVVVLDVVRNSPAEKAGLQPYDVILEIDQEKLEEMNDLARIIGEKEIGEEIMIRVRREGQTELLFAEIDQREMDY
ncbi:MAG: S1C family serine protease [Halarsenatibacteraceae bacterium]